MKTPADGFDTIVIGAGAAGLAAADALLAEGQSVCVLDARDRVGGRILTVTDASVPAPMELGAEFIHGRSKAVFTRLERSRHVAVDVSQSRWVVRNGRLQSGDARFDRMKQRLSTLALPARDLPFADFLERHRRVLSKPVRSLAISLVEGFDAADASRVSTKEILKEWSGSSAADAPSFRPSLGYGALLESIVGAFDPRRANLRLATVVREIKWKRGRVIVSATHQGQPVRVEGKHAVVAVPLGVLQLPARSPGAIRFDPDVHEQRSAWSRLSVGPVIKVVAHFKRAFWAEIDDGRYDDAAFFHCPGAPFPTCWTTLPSRTRVLNLWAGGPKASRLTGQRAGSVLELVFASLTSLFGSRLDYASLLETAHWHDWQQDIHACGAYSYPLIDAARARDVLAQPVDRTLFFAGEATDIEEPASVGGAFSSGERAAGQILRGERRRRLRNRRTHPGTPRG